MRQASYSNKKLPHYDKYPRVLQSYLNYKGAIENKSMETVRSYAYDLEFFIKYMVSIKDKNNVCEDISEIDIWEVDEAFFSSISREDILEYIYYLHSVRNNGAKTRYRKIESVKSFFNYLYAEKIVAVNVAHEIDTPKVSKSLPKYLTTDQSITLLSHIQSKYYERDYCILVMFLNCALRLSELTGINITDIRDDDTIHITGKGSKERTIYLTPACKDAINRYLAVRFNTERPIKDKNALFISPRTGERLKKRRIQQIVEDAIDTAGLSGMGLSTHKLRHTAATLMFQKGVDVRTLKEVLGHENLSTTEIYTHLNNAQIKQASSLNPLSNIIVERKDNKVS